MQPLLGCPVLRENDYSLVVPLATRPKGLIEPRQKFLGFGIGPRALLRRPVLEVTNKTALLVAQSLEDGGRAADHFVLSSLVLFVVGVILLDPNKLPFECAGRAAVIVAAL